MTARQTERLRCLVYIAEPHNFGGSQRLALRLFLRLRERVDVQVWFPSNGICVDEFKQAGLSVELIEVPHALTGIGKTILRQRLYRRLWLTARYLVPYTLRLARRLRRERFDICHCSSTRAVLLAGLGSRLARIPVIWHVQGHVVAHTLMKRFAEHVATRILVVAEALAFDISRGSRGKVRIARYGIDEEHFALDSETSLERISRTLLHRPPLQTDSPIVAMICSVVPHKGIHVLLEAIGLVNLQSSLMVVIAGPLLDPEYKEYLDEIVRRNGLEECVSFLGYVTRPEVVHRLADIVLMTSPEQEELVYGGRRHLIEGNEGLPIVILEAMYLGKPVVATDVCGVREQVIDGKTGFVVNPGDVHAIADALLTLTDNPELRKSFGQAAEAFVRARFSTDEMLMSVTHTYAEVSAKRI